MLFMPIAGIALSELFYLKAGFYSMKVLCMVCASVVPE